MTMIVGTHCDGCGSLDVDTALTGSELDNFPRNGWMSVNVHNEKGKPEGIEMHVCSVPCLNRLVDKLMEGVTDENESQNDKELS